MTRRARAATFDRRVRPAYRGIPDAAAVGIAYGSAELFGVSFALGAFFAGMVMRESALISIALNPLLFRLIEPAQAWIRSRSELARLLERSDDPLAELPPTVDQSLLSGHVVLVGYGHVGRRIGEALVSRGVPIVVAEQNREILERLRDQELAAGMTRHVIDAVAAPAATRAREEP